MSKWFLKFANGLLSLVIGLGLLTAVLYAGYALWDNRQVYAAAENHLGDLAPELDADDFTQPATENTTGTEITANAESGSGIENGTKTMAANNNTAETETMKETQTETQSEKQSDYQTGSQNETAAAAEAGKSAGSQESTESTEGETKMQSLFRRLNAINEDIGAWIRMPGTAIDYAVVQGDTNLHYLSTDIYGNFSIAGSIYLDSRNKADYTDVYNLLYGHNMSENRMFSDVNLYKDETFFRENQKGYIYFSTGAHWLQNISIILTSAADSWFLNPVSWAEIDGEKILELVQTNAVHISEEGLEALQAKLDAGEQPRIVALSTCSTEFTDARTILLTLLDP